MARNKKNDHTTLLIAEINTTLKALEMTRSGVDFKKIARNIGISPTTLAARIDHVEKYSGRLFICEADGRRIPMPSPQGEYFAKNVKDALNILKKNFPATPDHRFSTAEEAAKARKDRSARRESILGDLARSETRKLWDSIPEQDRPTAPTSEMQTEGRRRAVLNFNR